MEVTRKPLAKVEGRKRMQASGLTVAWYGTRHLKDWVAYLEESGEDGRLVLAHQVSERAVKSLLVRIQTLSRDELRAMGRPADVVAEPSAARRCSARRPASTVVLARKPAIRPRALSWP